MEFVGVGALVALVLAAVNFAKFVMAREVRPAVWQAVAWLAGVAATMLAARTDFAESFVFGDFTLKGLNGASQVFLGLMVASTASVIVQAIKAVDNSQSAKVP